MKLPGIALAALLLLSLCAVPPAQSRHAGIFAYPGYSMYAMGDVNDNLDSPASFVGTTTSDPKHINGGWNAGAGFRVWVFSQSYLEIGVNYLRASTSGSGTMFGGPYTADLDVSGIGVTGAIGSLPWASGDSRFGFAVGGGYYFADASASIRSTTLGNGSTDIEGSGPGFHAAALYDRPLGSTVHLDAALGYRYARTNGLRTNFVGDWVNADGSKARIDWSGPFIRVGIAIYPKENPTL